ncbi:protein smoothened-like [Belonocnema kinseyi]|uniref:protein smoothened-like n=1 Tax=Belonocnema kinseyi TaxID=2817044 RepID=UPI00143D292D|nr:protein smoothened-like [Belonocnema kinseyi]
MGTILPYSETSFELIPEYSSIKMIKEKLIELQGLRHIPKCWANVQSLVCSLFMPSCSNNVINMPSQETCTLAMAPCRAALNHAIWPSFIKCEDTQRFPSGCRHDTRDIKFNNSGRCLAPLIQTDDPLAFFEGVDGCGYPCNDPLFSSEEHRQIHSFVAWAAGICFLFNLFTVLTFMVDWRSSNKYPAVVIFYINCCFMISCIGWLIQFTPGSREIIVCTKDGTLRRSEPSAGNLSCVVVFVLVYYSMVAAMVWFVILTYAWHMNFQALHKIQDKIDKKAPYLHLMAWCLPLMLTVTIMALGEIDGNSVTGICFVGYFNHSARVWFLLVPLGLVLLIGGFFLFRALLTLIRTKRGSEDYISEHASSKIRAAIMRMGLFSAFMFIAVFVTIYCHIYDFYHSEEWNQSFRKCMMCSITTKYTDLSDCKMESKPTLGKLQVHLLSHFFAGILMSSWAWTRSAIDIWVRFFRRICNREVEEEKKRKKHKVIAQAFAKRNTFHNDGRLSINLCSSHEDPVGLNFDLNSVASQALSSTWAAALPKLVARRGAIIDKLYSSGSISSNRRNSFDSEISSFRRVSVESRRNSLDSQISLTIEELKTTRKFGSSRTRHGKRRKEFAKKKWTFFRRRSSTSQESQQSTQIMNALTNGYVSTVSGIQLPNMNRRPALSIHELPKMNGKSVGKLLPFLLPSQSGSQDEKVRNESSIITSEVKSIDVEAGNPQNYYQVLRDNGSHVGEETKMLKWPEDQQDRIKSKSSNRDNERRSRESRRSKYIQDKTLKHLLQESDIKLKPETEAKCNLINGGICDLVENLPLYCQERIQTNESTSVREIATLTSDPVDVLEMEELNHMIDEIISNRRET